MDQRMLIVTFTLLGFLSTSCALNAQEPTTNVEKSAEGHQGPIKNMRMPTITEQHHMLETMVGEWTIKGHTFKNCPYGEGTFTATENNELMKGGLFLVSRTQYSELFKNSQQIAFYGFDPTTQKYTWAMHSNLGVVLNAKGSLRDENKKMLVGNAIHWRSWECQEMPLALTLCEHAAKIDGDQIYTTEMVSPNEYKFKLVVGGQPWYEGTARKVNVVNPVP